jgi:hypothetical protein
MFFYHFEGKRLSLVIAGYLWLSLVIIFLSFWRETLIAGYLWLSVVIAAY